MRYIASEKFTRDISFHPFRKWKFKCGVEIRLDEGVNVFVHVGPWLIIWYERYE